MAMNTITNKGRSFEDIVPRIGENWVLFQNTGIRVLSV